MSDAVVRAGKKRESGQGKILTGATMLCVANTADPGHDFPPGQRNRGTFP